MHNASSGGYPFLDEEEACEGCECLRVYDRNLGRHYLRKHPANRTIICSGSNQRHQYANIGSTRNRGMHSPCWNVESRVGLNVVLLHADVKGSDAA